MVNQSAEESIENNEDRIKLIRKMEKEMKAAAARLDFERAAQIRDRIYQLENPTN
jgi:excinuclease UvrABC helicase subunit UvrB